MQQLAQLRSATWTLRSDKEREKTDAHAHARIRVVHPHARGHRRLRRSHQDLRRPGDVRPGRHRRREGRLRVHADPRRPPVLGRLDDGRDDDAQDHQDAHAHRRAAELHQSGAAGEDDRHLRPAEPGPHLRQPHRRPERGREHRRGCALEQGAALRDHGRGGLDPEGLVDPDRADRLEREILHAREGRADAQALPEARTRNSIWAAVPDRRRSCRPSTPTCTCSGATPPNRSSPT